MLNSTIRDILIVLWSVYVQQIIKERNVRTLERGQMPFSSRVEGYSMLDYLLQIIPTIADGFEGNHIAILYCMDPIHFLAVFYLLWYVYLNLQCSTKSLKLSYLMRGSPLMLQILFVYYAFTYHYRWCCQMDDATAAVLTFVLKLRSVFM